MKFSMFIHPPSPTPRRRIGRPERVANPRPDVWRRMSSSITTATRAALALIAGRRRLRQVDLSSGVEWGPPERAGIEEPVNAIGGLAGNSGDQPEDLSQ